MQWGQRGSPTCACVVCLDAAGTAVSNVFDGNRDLDGHALKGISRRCKIGLLTLFEWYKYVEVSAAGLGG